MNEEELTSILGGMDAQIGWAEIYRASLEGVGFSREAAEVMTAQQHALWCSALNRAHAAQALAQMPGPEEDPLPPAIEALTAELRVLNQNFAVLLRSATFAPIPDA